MKIKTPVKKQKTITSPQTTSETASPHANTAEEESSRSEEDVKVFIVTKSIKDDSDDNNNWKKVPFQLIPSKSTPTKEHYVCYIEDFDKEEIDKVRVGILTENNFKTKNITAQYYMDGKLMSNIHRDGPVSDFTVNKGTKYFYKIKNFVTKEEYPLILQKNIIAQDIDEVCELNVLEKIGIIKVKLVMCIIVYNNNSNNTNLSNSPNNNNLQCTFGEIKIKESQTKQKALSVRFGDSKEFIGESKISTFFDAQPYKEYEFEYYTKLGYLFRLRQCGLSIDNVLPSQQQSSSNNNEPEIIVIDDDNNNDNTNDNNSVDELNIILQEKLKKITRKDFVIWNCNKISKWIDELDTEFMENNIGNIMKEHKIDGTTFLELTVDDMKNELNIVALGLRLKLQRIIKYLKKL
ncbi:hypothetical protein ABK040_000493 [Willaertia magna]